MDILFFRIGNRIAGMDMQSVLGVLHDKETMPFIPVSKLVRNIVAHRGKTLGIIDLHLLFQGTEDESRDIIHVAVDGREYGFAVRKILLVRKLPKRLFSSDRDSFFISPDFLDGSCKIGKKSFPVISAVKVLEYPEIRQLWFKSTILE